VGSPMRWARTLDRTVATLTYLVSQGQFSRVSLPAVKALSRVGCSDALMDFFNRPAAYLHGDLTGDNLFVTPEGIKVIDWQKTGRGPVELDLVHLLDSSGFNPRSSLGPEPVAAHAILAIDWFSACAARWFEPGVETYDRQIDELIQKVTALDLM